MEVQKLKIWIEIKSLIDEEKLFVEAEQNKELIHYFPSAEGVQLLPGKQDLTTSNSYV